MKQCPICYNELEVRDCAPCHDCGGDPKEIEHFKAGLHTYTVYEVYQDLRLTLCNFCDVDFGAYKPEYLGLPKGQRLGYQHFRFIKKIENPSIEKDGFCVECNKRLKFLHFLLDLIEKVKQQPGN